MGSKWGLMVLRGVACFLYRTNFGNDIRSYEWKAKSGIYNLGLPKRSIFIHSLLYTDAVAFFLQTVQLI